MSAKKITLSALLILILGLLFGWFLHQWMIKPVVSPVDPAAAPITERPASQAGFCCITPKTACTSVENPDYCFRSAGKAFNTSEENCNRFCTRINF